MDNKEILAREVSKLIKEVSTTGDKNSILLFGKQVEEQFGETIAEEVVEGTLTILSALNKA